MPIKDKKPKIAFFHLAFMYSGGGEKLVLKEVQLLREQGYDIDLYTPLLSSKDCFPDIINQFNIKEIIPGFSQYFKNRPEIGVMLTCLLFPLIFWRFKQYELVIGANQPGPVFGWLLKILLNKPYIIYLAQPTRMIYSRPIDQKHGYRLKNKMHLLPHIINTFRPIFFWIDLKSIRNANLFLCNGKYMQEILSQVYGIIPTVCPAGAQTINPDLLAITISRRFDHELFTINQLSIPKPYIFLSNRHFPHKKFEYALEALDKLDNKVHLLITGKSTDYTGRLKSLVKYYKLEEYVHFLEYVSESELKKLYLNAALYLYTAPEEDFGMGVIEAMGQGVPVIAWDNAGPSKIITHQYDGILVPPGDIYQLKEEINHLLTNPKLYSQLAQNALTTVETKFSWQNHCTQFEDAISETVKPEPQVEVSIEYASDTI